MSDTLTITTDHKWKDLKYHYEVPAKVLADQFDHLDPEDNGYDGYIQYRGRWYHLSDFMTLDKSNPLHGHWKAYLSDSFYSGIVLRLSNDCEQYQIGTFTS
jgi:hypothetical protein